MRGLDFGSASGEVWKEVIDLSFEQGVAAIAVDGVGFANDNEDGTSYDDDTPSPTKTITITKTGEIKNR